MDITNTITLWDTNGAVVYVGQIVAPSQDSNLVTTFLASLALGAGLSVSWLTYRKVKEGLNATSGD